MLHKTREDFHSHIEPRKGIFETVKRQLDKGEIADKLIHLCFTYDPYPCGVDTTVTRKIIKAIKASGNHVQILTKGSGAERDFYLLDGNDWFGVTISGDPLSSPQAEPEAADVLSRAHALAYAHNMSIITWVSCEPVLREDTIFRLIADADCIDLYRTGKLNYHPSDINWGEFGRECERLCKLHGRNYYIKDDLRKEMEAQP